MAINILDGFSLRAKKFLDARSSFPTLDEMNDYDANSVPEGFVTYNEEDKKSYQWDGQQWVEYSAGGGGDGGMWDGTDPTVVTVGGLKEGTVLDGKTPLEIIDMMVNPYMSPVINISIAPATTLYEIGKTATVTVTANLTKKTKDIEGARILKNNADLKVADEGEITAKTFNQAAVSFDTDTTFTSKVSDAEGEVSGNTINVRFTRKSFYGLVGAGDSITTDTGIEGLGSDQLTGTKGLTWNNLTANNQKLVYAYPASFGDLTSIKDQNNFEYLASFTKTTVQRDTVAYNVYTLNDPMSITGAKVIFS